MPQYKTQVSDPLASTSKTNLGVKPAIAATKSLDTTPREGGKEKGGGTQKPVSSNWSKLFSNLKDKQSGTVDSFFYKFLLLWIFLKENHDF